MFLHKFHHGESDLYTLFDSKERVCVFATGYLNQLRMDDRPIESQRQIADVVKQHCRWIEQESYFRDLTVDEALKEISVEDVYDWIKFERNSQVSLSTIYNRESIIRSMYDWFTTDKAGVRKDTPWLSKYYTREQHKKIPRFLTVEQIITLLNGMHNESQRAAAHFMVDTGVRISEMLRMRQMDLPNELSPDYNYYPLVVKGSKARGGGYKIRTTMISRPMLARIRRYHSSLEYKLADGWDMYDPEKPMFLNVKGDPLSKMSVYKSIKTAWLRQGGDPSKVSPQRLRHSTGYSVMISELSEHLSGNMVILKGMLGHESIKTTEIYSGIPLVVLQSLTKKKEMLTRYEEADQIYQLTFLPGYKNIEKRGRKSNEKKCAN